MCGVVIVFVEGDCLMVSRVVILLPAYVWGCDCFCRGGLFNGFTGSKIATRICVEL